MLQIKNISKEYITGDLKQIALDDVSLNLRDNEFVAILGPSGSGKTTLLNIIGGLDQYDKGDLIINGISTKQYQDRDWDSYRNHTIGFVFQSYNLIPHQTILSNVELALTISGISKADRRKRAKTSLQEVGLGDQLHKRPNQLSGGQMQRVAIARALVNNPDILLADEPTGALDSATSLHVMDLLEEIAKNRLVVMVTHNPELASTFATRIINLKDGKIMDDSSPCAVSSCFTNSEHKNMGKTSLSFLTTLTLSFNNLKSKKGRTILTSFAGSIGIIGIALILALSNGVNTYIDDLQKSTMSSYPITIESQSMDMSNMIETGSNETLEAHELDAIYANPKDLVSSAKVASSIKHNNLSTFKSYLDNPEQEINQYIGNNGIVYTYDTKFDIFAYDPQGVLINTDGSTFTNRSESKSNVAYMQQQATTHVTELMAGTNKEMVNQTLIDSYDILYGSWPTAYNQVVLTVDENNEISSKTLYELGILPSSQYQSVLQALENGEDASIEAQSWSYEEIAKQTLYMLPACDNYKENQDGTFQVISKESDTFSNAMDQAITLDIVGILRAKENAVNASIGSTIAYPKALTDYLIEYTNDSPLVLAQKANKETNILTGATFPSIPDAQGNIITYEENLKSFGVVSLDSPSAINIYVDSFENKEAISKGIDTYNASVSEVDRISYTDYIAFMISSITTIVNIISYVLIAFVAVSLIVSSIMIGIITYISVLERTKEIGILRAIGASKRNISQVFNAETFIIGLCSGGLGIVITLLLLLPINAIIHLVAGTTTINASLPFLYALILVCLSVILTLIGGFIPAKKAARKDPVTALRSE